MSCHTELYSGGDVGSASEPMYIYLYPNRSGDDNESEGVIANRLNTACSDLRSSGAVEAYKIAISYDHPDLSASKKGDLLTKFGNWTSSHGCLGINYDEFIGVHLCVSGQIGNGVAGETRKSTFQTSNNVVTGTGYGVKEYFANIAIHEAFHPFIKPRVSEVDSLIEDSEHDLGRVYSFGKTSPMCTTYENEHGPHGNCDNQAPFAQQYNPHPTNCTINAIKYTREKL